MKTKNKHFGRLLCCSFAAVVTTAAVYAAVTPAQRRFFAEYSKKASEGFCGNSRVADYDGIMERHGVTNEQMKDLLPCIVNECLDVDIPRNAQTNEMCATALRMMFKYGDPDSFPAAERAYFDATGKFKAVSRLALFACATNVGQVSGFASRVWATPTGASSSERIALIVAVGDWAKSQTNQVSNLKDALSETFASYVACETNAAVALRLDMLMNYLSQDYSSSALRTNLVWRFKDDRSALRDPEYFRRLSDSMGVCTNPSE